MNIFESQLEMRSRLDEEQKINAYSKLAAGLGYMNSSVNDGEGSVDPRDKAVALCLEYYGVKAGEVPDETGSEEERLYYLCRMSGTMHRKVSLEKQWYKNTFGPMLGSLNTGETVTLLPKGFRGYICVDPVSGKSFMVNKKNGESIAKEAVLFYRALPAETLTVRDMLLFMASSLDRADYLGVFFAALAATLVGLLPVWANRIAFGIVIPEGIPSLVAPVAALLAGAAVAGILFDTCRDFVRSRISMKAGICTEAAVYSRLLSLPSAFFRRFDTGSLAMRIAYIKVLAELLGHVFFGAGLTFLLGFIYLIQVASFAPALVFPAFITLVLQAAMLSGCAYFGLRYEKEKANADAKLSGTVTSILGGIQKIRLAGAENRAFAKWADSYAAYAGPMYNRPRALQAMPAFVTVIGLVGGIYIFHRAALNGVNTAGYMAFSAAYGQMSAVILEAVAIIGRIVQIRPMLDLIEPILKEEPERRSDMPLVSSITGSLELSNVSFRYDVNGRYVLQDISMSIKPGEYVAIVGSSGSGKTTLARLMMGFEMPEKGSIFYDMHDVSRIDVQSLRRLIGSVIQNGKLFMGNIFYNIILSSPGASLDDAWEAAELAGIADDIRNMPMGMQTLISENGSGLSGGQRQRLLIARAICSHPKLLILDEATSALDNVTQKQVMESLEKLKCTRIVIAHRLSTVENCGHIICLDKGRIVEEGSYKELLEKNGYFAELVSAQQI